MRLFHLVLMFSRAGGDSLPWSCFQLCAVWLYEPTLLGRFHPNSFSVRSYRRQRGRRVMHSLDVASSWVLGPARSFFLRWFSTEEQPWWLPRLPLAVWPGREFHVSHTSTGPLQAGVNQSISKIHSSFPVIINALPQPGL